MATIVLAVLTALLVLASLLPFLRVAHGFVRVFAFPRLQILALAVAVLAALPFAGPFPWHGRAVWPLAAGLLLVVALQVAAILPFTPLWRIQSRLHRGPADGPDTVSVLSFNVKMSNRRYADALALAARVDPDIALFMETDAPWCAALAALKDRWPHVVARPLPNAYGMILFSRLPLSDISVDCLVMEEVPSIHATVTLPDGQRFRFHAVHPEPPVPHVDSLGRDGELLIVARLAAAEPLPSVVTGDLNDVAWSHTTRLFQRVSGLLDPRIGRGLYNTFDARFRLLRWPLDHLFHDRRFTLVGMARLPACGSDHFPMTFRLALTRSDQAEDRPAPPDAADRAEAAAVIAESRQLGREAIGTDWES